MRSVLTSPRWLALGAFVLLVVVGCLLLARWQLNRADERSERNRLLEQNLEAPAVPVGTLAGPAEALPKADEWRAATFSGEYAAADQRLLRRRPLDGRLGFHVLVPLVGRGPDGPMTLWVNRGWVPAAASAAEAPEVPAPPPGPVEVTVRLRPPADGPARSEGVPADQVDRVAVGELPAPEGAPAVLAYGQLVEERPASAEAPVLLDDPGVSAGPHLSYAFQWACFAVIAVVGFVVLARKESTADQPHGATADASAG